MADTEQQHDEADIDQPQSIISHLIELRTRMMHALACVLIVFLCLFYFANDIYVLLADPLMRHLPKGAGMIATEVASPFLAPFKLTLVLSVIISIPYLFYQLWAFIAPGLYRHEKRLMVPLLASSTLLFYLGMLFAYFVVFPLIFAFFTSAAPEGVTVMTDISSYLNFVLKIFFAFGLAFEVPIATFLLVKTGMTTAKSLGEKRPYIIVGAFVLGMLLTPPDVVSQVLLAVPVWLLYEIGLLFCRNIKVDEEDAASDEPVNPLNNS
jgi:sec-independent protein translocase protein TatC